MTAAVLAPTGTLRTVINLGNPVLTHGTPDAPGGVTVAIARVDGSAYRVLEPAVVSDLAL